MNVNVESLQLLRRLGMVLSTQSQPCLLGQQIHSLCQYIPDSQNQHHTIGTIIMWTNFIHAALRHGNKVDKHVPCVPNFKLSDFLTWPDIKRIRATQIPVNKFDDDFNCFNSQILRINNYKHNHDVGIWASSERKHNQTSADTWRWCKDDTSKV